VPVEEPSTASQAEIAPAVLKGERSQMWISNIDGPALLAQAEVTGDQQAALEGALIAVLGNGQIQLDKINFSPPVLQIGQSLFRHISCPGSNIVTMAVETDQGTATWDFNN
jgi:hypothetical protein